MLIGCIEMDLSLAHRAQTSLTVDRDVVHLTIGGNVVHLTVDGNVTHLNVNGEVVHLNIKDRKEAKIHG